jgi:hypothetical protein
MSIHDGSKRVWLITGCSTGADARAAITGRHALARVARPSPQHLAQQRLGSATAINVGPIDQIDPETESPVDTGNGTVPCHAARVGQPRTQCDVRDAQSARPQLPISILRAPVELGPMSAPAVGAWRTNELPPRIAPGRASRYIDPNITRQTGSSTMALWCRKATATRERRTEATEVLTDGYDRKTA